MTTTPTDEASKEGTLSFNKAPLSLRARDRPATEDYLTDPLFVAYFSALEAIAAYLSDIHCDPRRERAPRVAAALKKCLRVLGLNDSWNRIGPLLSTGNTTSGAVEKETSLHSVRALCPVGFALLAPPLTCSLGQLRAVYRKAAFKHHPDRGGTHDAMLAINEAFASCQALIISGSGRCAETPGRLQPSRRARGKWGASSAGEFEALCLYILAEIACDDYAYDEAYGHLLELLCKESVLEGLRTLSTLPDQDLPLWRGGPIYSLVFHTSEWLRVSNRVGEAEALENVEWVAENVDCGLPESDLSGDEENTDALPENTRVLNLRFTHVRRLENARRLGLVDERRYNNAKKRFLRRSTDRDKRQAALETFLERHGFLKRLPSEEVLPEEESWGEVPSPNYMQWGEGNEWRYAALSPRQRGEYRKAFSNSATVELLTKYHLVREIEIYRSLFRHFAQSPRDRIREECAILVEVIAATDVPGSFERIPALIEYLEGISAPERKGLLGELRRKVPMPYWLAYEPVERIGQWCRNGPAEQEAVSERRAAMDYRRLERFQKEHGAIRLLQLDQANVDVIATEFGEYCRALIAFGESLAIVEELQLGYYMDRLTGALVRMNQWSAVTEWLEMYFALPERYRFRSARSETDRLTKRLERARRLAGG